VIIEVEQLFGNKAMIHGSYKVKGQTVYVFDMSGTSYGVFTMKNDILVAASNSQIKSLTNATLFDERMAIINNVMLGKWTLGRDKTGMLEFRKNDVVIYSSRYASRLSTGTWSATAEADVTIRVSIRGASTKFTGSLASDKVLVLHANNMQITADKISD
jgi:hypothetical protein